MMSKRKLEMDFLDEDGKRFRLGVDNPKEDLDRFAIEGAMEAIINENIFQSNGGDVVGIEAARVITTTVMEIEL